MGGWIGARVGGKQLLAVADEEGSINLIDTDKDNQWDSGPSPFLPPHREYTSLMLKLVDASRTTFQAHQNAIFDLAWSNDDGILVRSSPDSLLGLS